MTEDYSRDQNLGDAQLLITGYINQFLQVYDISPEEGYRTDSYSNEEILEIQDIPMDTESVSLYLRELNKEVYNSFFKVVQVKNIEGELLDEVLDSCTTYDKDVEDLRVDAHVLEGRSFAIVFVVIGNNDCSTIYIKHLEKSTGGLVNRWWKRRNKNVDLMLVDLNNSLSKKR